MRADRNSRARGVAGCRGQALVEVSVALLALAPLFIAIPLLAKYQDIQRAVVEASRYLAFECTVRRAACADNGSAPALASEVGQRLFGEKRASVQARSAPPEGTQAARRDPSWQDRAGVPLLERFEDVTVRLARPRFDSPLSLAGSIGERSVPGAVRLLSQLGGPARFGLEIDTGLVEATVEARVARSRAPGAWATRLDAIPLMLSARTVLLTDPWTASGPYGPQPDTVEARVDQGARLPLLEPLIDAGYLPVRGVLQLAGAIGLEPRARLFRYHRVDVDRVPPDRIAVANPVSPGAAPPADPPPNVEAP